MFCLVLDAKIYLMFGFNQKIDTDEGKIEEILTRGVGQIFPSKEALKKELLSGRRLRIYAGIDATGRELHLGHTKNLLLLEKFRKLGHEVILLFGDFTARIGDPTDKSAARVRLSKKEVEENLKTWKKQISKIVTLNGSNPIKIRRNGRWLSKLSFEDVIELASNLTVQQMIERDMFQKRLKENRPIYLHEFLYPLMQGYDSEMLDVDVEIGGTDQIFNMLAGRVLRKKLGQKEKYVMATTLLEDTKTGKKLMSKSEGSYVSLKDGPDDMFGGIMTLPDNVIVPLFTGVTGVPMSTISEIEGRLNSGSINPMGAKKQLAVEIVSIYHGKDKAIMAAEKFDKTFSKKEIPEDISVVPVKSGTLLAEILLANKIISSKSEWRRLIEQGGISRMEDDSKISDFDYKVEKSETYRIGKRRFIKVEPNLR